MVRDAFPELRGRGLFLSPHPDDAALSCGRLIARLADDGRAPAVVTVFGGDMVDDALSEYARGKHEVWRAQTVDDVRARRRAEDEASCAILGASLRWLGYPDAIYRADRYVDHDAIFRDAPHPDEERLADVIADEIESLPETREADVVVVPLAAGGHVDHRTLFAVGQRLAARGRRVIAAEDCPYAIHSPDLFEARVSAAGGVLGAPLAVDIAATLERRVAASLAHASQIPNIFRFTDDPAGALRGFADARAPGLPAAEVFWPLDAA